MTSLWCPLFPLSSEETGHKKRKASAAGSWQLGGDLENPALFLAALHRELLGLRHQRRDGELRAVPHLRVTGEHEWAASAVLAHLAAARAELLIPCCSPCGSESGRAPLGALGKSHGGGLGSALGCWYLSLCPCSSWRKRSSRGWRDGLLSVQLGRGCWSPGEERGHLVCAWQCPERRGAESL